MNPRHAAALALVGWYLIAPQPVVTPGSRVQNWTILKTFPTRQECEAQRHRNNGAQCIQGREPPHFNDAGLPLLLRKAQQ
jgi:hypothetical protein